MYNETEYLRSLPLSDRIVVLREKALRLQAEQRAFEAMNPMCARHPGLREEGGAPCIQCQADDEVRDTEARLKFWEADEAQAHLRRWAL